MRQTYAIRSLIITAGLALVGLAVIVQMIRIQNSEQAKIFLSRGDRYAGEFTDLAKVVRGEKKLAWNAAHDIAVHETVMRAAGVWK